MKIDRRTKGRIKLVVSRPTNRFVGAEELWWRAPSRGVTSKKEEAFLYTYSEYQEYVSEVRRTGRNRLRFETD